MKIKILLSVFILSMSVVLSSYRNGAESHSGYNGTGANGSAGCSCHTPSTGLSPTVELDSAGVAVTSYIPGASYTVKISGVNNTGGTLGSFGFQLCTVLDAGAGTSSATAIGTWGSSLPTNVRFTQGVGHQLPVIEQSASITATTGSGGAGTTYVESIPWTAPAAGTGSIRIYGVLNAVTGLDIDFLCSNQAATPVTITEAVPAGIRDLSDKLSSFNVYPTLMTDNVTIAFDMKESAAVSVSLISLQGQEVKTLMSQKAIGQGSFKESFNVNGLATGIYLMRLQIGDAFVVFKVVKD
jgi:hypothetical protein